MKFGAIFAAILSAMALVFFSHARKADFPVLKGPYLGQKPPGMTPEIFAPGIVSTKSHREFSSTFTPDGKIMFFNSNRPYPGSVGERRPTQIWFMERLGTRWGEPKHLCEGMFTNASKLGNIYLNGGITRLVDGKLTPLQKIPGAMNAPPAGWKRGQHSCIAPDESFLIYDTQKTGSEWDSDENLFVCFRKEDGTWSEARDLGGELNLPGGKMLATISPDNQCLFFCNGGDIDWVSLKVFDELGAKLLR